MLKMRAWAAVALASLLGFGCGGGGSSGSPIVATSDAGVTAIISSTADGKAYALPNGQFTANLQVSVKESINLSDLELAVEASQGAVIDATSGGWKIRFTGSSSPGTRTIPISVTNKVSGARTSLNLVVETMAPTSSSTVSVTGSGGTAVLSNGSALKFQSGNQLASPVTATVTEGVSPAGSKLIMVAFATPITGKGVQVVFPDLNSGMDSAVATIPATLAPKAVTKAFSLAATSKPYATVDDSLGFLWLTFNAWYLGDARIPADRAIEFDDLNASTAAAAGDGMSFSVEQKLSSRLSGVQAQSTLNEDIGNVQPVIFVHGFNPRGLTGLYVGGGKDTWQNFPALVREAGYLPFEFQWKTDARFVDVAADLARSIREINRRTGGKKVHIVAHSFGGVLARTLLQSMAQNVPPDKLADAIGAVASLTTLGSPHSGIADVQGSVVGTDGVTSVTLPIGQDALTFNACGQISCHVMGEPVWDGARFAHTRAVLGIRNQAGEHAVALSQSTTSLPPVPIFVGIGLRVTRAGNSYSFGPGDALISYAGQRLTPGDGIKGLRGAVKVGSATISEVVLGINRDVSPGDALNASDLSVGDRKWGYLHSGSTGAALTSPGDPNSSFVLAGWAETSGGFGFGIEAAVLQNCSSVAACNHAGFKLFLASAASTCAAPRRQVGGQCVDIPSVDSVVASDFLMAGTAGTIVVTGKYLPSTVKMSIGGVACSTYSNASSTGFTATCTPGGTVWKQPVTVTDGNTGVVIDSSKQLFVNSFVTNAPFGTCNSAKGGLFAGFEIGSCYTYSYTFPSPGGNQSVEDATLQIGSTSLAETSLNHYVLSMPTAWTASAPIILYAGADGFTSARTTQLGAIAGAYAIDRKASQSSESTSLIDLSMSSSSWGQPRLVSFGMWGHANPPTSQNTEYYYGGYFGPAVGAVPISSSRIPASTTRAGIGGLWMLSTNSGAVSTTPLAVARFGASFVATANISGTSVDGTLTSFADDFGGVVFNGKTITFNATLDPTTGKFKGYLTGSALGVIEGALYTDSSGLLMQGAGRFAGRFDNAALIVGAFGVR